MWVTTSVPYLTPRQAGQLDAWSEEAAQAGRVGTQKLRDVAEEVPPAEVAVALGIAADERAVVRRRTMLLDGGPVELTDSWYPAEIARGTALAELGKIKGGAVTLLADLGYRVDDAREEVAARGASAEEAAELEIEEGAPVLVLRRTSLTAEGKPFEVSVMVNVPGRNLRYRVKAG
ncbi:UTRA domain-containing protein [Actinomadura hibisca]|uniref:UTRA domain-containing protein n=1 Tax=Actinomadura hibisca TaxID=68565 RepID=UPI00082EBCF8|nr:UTRA domain-containing protein [Actinomadura hibisca]